MICADANGGAILDRRGIACSLEQDGATAAVSLLQDLGAHQDEWIENSPHRPFAQRIVAVEARGDPVTADHAHHQARTRSGIAEIERIRRRQQCAKAHAADGPVAVAQALDVCAELRAGAAGVQHVLAFEQAGDLSLSHGEEAEQKGAMRYALVAGRADPPAQASASFGCQRFRRHRM